MSAHIVANVSAKLSKAMCQNFPARFTAGNSTQMVRLHLSQMKKPMMQKGGDVKKIQKTFKPKKNLKKVDAKKNPGLAKLPTKVRNKMGFMKKGGAVK